MSYDSLSLWNYPHMGPNPAPARLTFPIDIANHEHGRIDGDYDTEEEAPAGDTDVAAT